MNARTKRCPPKNTTLTPHDEGIKRSPHSAAGRFRLAPFCASCASLRSLILLAGLTTASLAQTPLEKAWLAFYRGEYAAAASAFAQATAHDTTRIGALVGQSLAMQELGHYQACRDLLTAAQAKQPDAQLVQRLGELELFLGNHSAALRCFEEALHLAPEFRAAQFYSALVNWHRGERTNSRRTLLALRESYRKAPNLTAHDIHLIARACAYLEKFQDANRLFTEAVKKQPEDWQLYVPWGELFLEKYNLPDAQSVFGDALKRNPNCGPALLGLARVQAASALEQALKTAESALKLNPTSPATHTLIAELFLSANKEKEAGEKIAAVARQFPHYTPALALQAVLAERAQKPNDVTRLANAAAMNNPKDASLFVRLGEDTARRYLFQESVAYFRRALAIDSENWSAAAGLGSSLSRLGEEQEAKIYLEQVYKHDPFNVIAVNLLNLFDDLAKYDTIRTAHFLIRMHAEDRPLLGATAAELCEAAYKEMAPRYRVNFAKPIKIEIFPKHDDFAVRCFGLPGAEVFLGICFGPLLAMDSPRARERGAFNWQETLWHEIAHAVHLELTANRIPRWLAEGLAVYEATRARSEWNMNLELAMIRALRNNSLLPLRELDEGFTQRPETVSLVYYQASQIVAFINERHGFDKVLALLPHFKQGRKTAEAIRLVFALSLDNFDKNFHAFLRQRFQPDSVEVEWEAQNLPAAQQSETLRRKAEAAPKNFFAALAYGGYLAKHGQPVLAEMYLQRAKKLLPAYVEAGNPYAILAELYWKHDRQKEAASELEFLTSRNGKALDEALKLGEWQLALKDTSAAVRAFARAVAIYPYQVEAQRRLGESLLAQQRPQAAVQTFHAALALHPPDRAGIYCSLAEAYLKAGQRAQAKKQILLALEIAPNYERAQDILLRTVE